MKSLFTFVFVLVVGFAAMAQEKKTTEIIIEGKPHTVTIGEEYKYVNAEGDTMIYFVESEHDAPKYIKTEFDKTEKVAVPKTQPEETTTTTAAKESKLQKLPIGQIKKKTEETNTASALLGKAYRFDDVTFGEKELANNKKLALVKVEDVLHTAYPSLEFLPEKNIAFCYNQPVIVYHGDEEEFQKLNTTMKVCKDGKWDEKDNSLQLSFELENRNKRINYNISELKAETLVMEKKTEHLF